MNAIHNWSPGGNPCNRPPTLSAPFRPPNWQFHSKPVTPSIFIFGENTFLDLSTLTTVLPWGIFVGIVFSTIGAAGGILTSFGMISLFGVIDPNSVKPMTQIVVLITALTYVPGYFRRRAIVLPLGLLLGAGGLLGAYVGSTLSSLYLSDMRVFRPVFGAMTLAVAVQIIWKLSRKDCAPECHGEKNPRVTGTKLTLQGLKFRHDGVDFHVSIWSPLVAGFLISLVAAIFGVGGGFLLVPYMASVLAMPMHIIPATAAIAIFMSLAVSISNFITLGASLQWGLLVPLAVGTVIGGLVGPYVNRSMKNHWLQGALAVIVAVIGVKYTLF